MKAAYAVKSTDLELRLNSSSGAVFSELCNEILKANGIVYGVSLSKDCRKAIYTRVDCREDTALLRGSKYVQAYVGDTFRLVKEDLDNNLKVLFSGTSCQVNGLTNFLGEKYPNLICVDVVCHGVPSPALWESYIEAIEGKTKSRLVDVNFRCKDSSWRDFGIKKITETRKELYISKSEDPYMRMFLNNLSLRPSCYECRAKEMKLSDISIADFWGIEKVAPEMDDGKGTSLVIVRTENGQELFDSIQDRLKWKTVSYEDSIKDNPSEYKSVDRPIKRDIFFEDMNSMSFEKLSKKYVEPSFKVKAKLKLKKILMRGGAEGNQSSSDYGMLFTFVDK